MRYKRATVPKWAPIYRCMFRYSQFLQLKMFPPCQANFYQEKFAQLIEAEVDRRLEAESELRVERERQVDFDCFSI